MTTVGEGNYVEVGLRLQQRDGGRLTANLDTSRQPLYSVGEVSKFFFKRQPGWLRWRERNGDLPGHGRADNGTRVYTLADVEDIVWTLVGKSLLSAEDAAAALITVAAQLIVWGYHCPHQESVDDCLTCLQNRKLNNEEREGQ